MKSKNSSQPPQREPSRPGVRLRASTMLEVLVALSLTSIIFVVGTMVWINVNGARSPVRQLEQRMVARQLISDAVNMKETGEAVFQVKGYKYLREISPLNERKGLYEVRVSVYSVTNEELFTRGKIVKYETD